ncbi:MAG TPA: hypothetical protein VN203_27655, partial [Candidatus Acidoferrum sp.]|nr:hypothetical protein [Candidatus Acidoferrum sp.]
AANSLTSARIFASVSYKNTRFVSGFRTGCALGAVPVAGQKIAHLTGGTGGRKDRPCVGYMNPVLGASCQVSVAQPAYHVY